jgi:hypothetical protein
LFEIFVEQQNPILTYNSLPPITSLNFYFLAVFNELCLQRKLAVAKTVKRFPEKYGKLKLLYCRNVTASERA